MVQLKFEYYIRKDNGYIIIERGSKAVEFLEKYGIEYHLSYDDISIKEDTVLNLDINSFDEMDELCKQYNALVTLYDGECLIKFK